MNHTEKQMLQALPNPEMLVGIDLGQSQDYTAISILERSYRLVGKPYNAHTKDRRGEWTIEARQKIEVQYSCRHLERLSLGTPYPDQVRHIVKLAKRLGKSCIVVDQTGVGRPIVDHLWTA